MALGFSRPTTTIEYPTLCRSARALSRARIREARVSIGYLQQSVWPGPAFWATSSFRRPGRPFVAARARFRSHSLVRWRSVSSRCLAEGHLARQCSANALALRAIRRAQRGLARRRRGTWLCFADVRPSYARPAAPNWLASLGRRRALGRAAGSGGGGRRHPRIAYRLRAGSPGGPSGYKPRLTTNIFGWSAGDKHPHSSRR